MKSETVLIGKKIGAVESEGLTDGVNIFIIICEGFYD